MYRRYHTPSKLKSEKWTHRPHTGVRRVCREQFGDWRAEVSHRTVGLAIRREQYSVLIRREAPAYEETLTGFSTRQAALAAARRRIDLLSHIRLAPRATLARG